MLKIISFILLLVVIFSLKTIYASNTSGILLMVTLFNPLISLGIISLLIMIITIPFIKSLKKEVVNEKEDMSTVSRAGIGIFSIILILLGLYLISMGIFSILFSEDLYVLGIIKIIIGYVILHLIHISSSK